MKVEIGHLSATLANARGDDVLSFQNGKLGAQSREAKKNSFFSGLMFWKRGDDAKANQDVRVAVKMCLLKTYGLSMDDKAFNAAMGDIAWHADHPLTARVVTQLVDKLNERRAGEFVDDKLQGGTRVLGSGNVNTVHLGEWGTKSGATEKMVFKAEFEQGNESLQVAAKAIGITESAANLSGRNVATYRLNQALGLNVIPNTQFAAHNGKPGSVMALAPGTSVQGGSSLRIPTSLTAAQFSQCEQTMKGWLGERGLALQGFDASTGDVTVKRAISEEDLHACANSVYVLKADGTIMSDVEILSDEELGPDFLAQWHDKRSMMETIVPDLSSTDAGLCSGLNQLQWLDCLCGQTDRHPGNIFVERSADGGVLGIKGIDNDASFGVNTSADKAVVPATVGSLSSHSLQAVENFYKGMPSMIDAGLKEQLLALADKSVLHADSLENLLDGYLSPQEVAQARVRLNEIAAELRKKDASGADVVKVVNSPVEWSSPDLGPYPERSYMAACMENIAQFVPKPMPVPDQPDGASPSDTAFAHPNPFRQRVIDTTALAADFNAIFGDPSSK